MTDATGPELLREAAKAMRVEESAFFHAVATWLETEARSWAGDEDHTDCTIDRCTFLAAYITARHYLSPPVSAGEPKEDE